MYNKQDDFPGPGFYYDHKLHSTFGKKNIP